MAKHAMTSSGMPAFAQHSFARVPNVKKPRSTFDRSKAYKTTLNAGMWIPVFVDEILPGDTFKVDASIFARLLSPLSVPIMDNLYMDWIAIYCPNRLVWEHFVNQMGEQATPSSSIDYTTPYITIPSGGFVSGSLADYFGLPLGIEGLTVSALPFRVYNLFVAQWVIAQNVIDSPYVSNGDGPDVLSNYPLAHRMKRPDYFTSCQPGTQKGSPVTLPIGTGVYPVVGDVNNPIVWNDSNSDTDTAFTAPSVAMSAGNLTGQQVIVTSNQNLNYANAIYGGNDSGNESGYLADFSSASGPTLNEFRLLAVTQQYLELDERGGTRFPEFLFNHFGVVSSDARLQRVEYVNGGSIPILTHVVPQTSVTAATPQANLAAFTSAHGRCSFSHSFEEHGTLMVLVEIRADLTYQQGQQKMWSRQTRYDYYDPLFANIGEQPVLNKEIYADGSGTDTEVFGYQEYAAEYRFGYGQVTGLMRYGVTGSIAVYNLSQSFTGLPGLNSTFLNDNPPVSRVVAVEDQPAFIFDSFWNVKSTRVMPVFSIPGLTRI